MNKISIKADKLSNEELKNHEITNGTFLKSYLEDGLIPVNINEFTKLGIIFDIEASGANEYIEDMDILYYSIISNTDAEYLIKYYLDDLGADILYNYNLDIYILAERVNRMSILYCNDELRIIK